MGDKKIVVIFPGGNYSIDCPLLYYSGFKFEARGYEKVAIRYGDLLKRDKTLDECIENIKSVVLTQLQAHDLSKYKENISLKQIDGVGHRLEVLGDMDKNIDVLREVLALY